MHLCPPHTTWSTFSSPCIRNTYAALLPFLLVVVFVLPWSFPKPLRKALEECLPLEEAEVLKSTGETAHAGGRKEDTWRQKRAILIPLLGLFQSLAWIGVGSYALVSSPSSQTIWSTALSAHVTSLTWIYTTVHPLLYALHGVPYKIFYIYAMHLVGAALRLGGGIYGAKVQGGVHVPGTWEWAGWIANIVVVSVLLAVVGSMRCAVPGEEVDRDEIGKHDTPEDYTTLWEWITFSWVYPLIRLGRATTLNEPNVWNLSLTLQSRLVFAKYRGLSPQATLLRKLWASNSRDIILDFALTLVSVVFAYTGPYFLRNILEAIDTPHPTSTGRAKAYIFAGLAFLATVAKAQADAQHLWYGRRAATRTRSQLMAAIYDKALKRKDLGGVVDGDRVNSGSATHSAGGAGLGGTKDQEKKVGGGSADVGKIVNLMAGDANRIAMLLSGVYFIYGAPFEIVIALTFLYQLLGLSAFAGFLILLLAWPLNSIVAKRSIRIQRALLDARDKRMGILNELIGAVKFIKFFAWEERWIGRTMERRGVEMGWMVKARLNMVLFSMIWAVSPILVSIISFFVYVKQGNQLTVSVAFTSIALFTMIRTPLNVIPTWIVQALQTKVALDRIAAFLDEEEVSDQVSVLRREQSGSESYRDGDERDEGIGLEGATLRWNVAATAPTSGDGRPKGKNNGNRGSDQATTSTTVASDTSHDEESTRFELKDINVLFPEGELSVVTGPTASGKTALLMAVLGELTVTSGRLILSKQPTKLVPSATSERGPLFQSISYAAQAPWLRHQSIKDNILFGSPFEEERYKEVVECCALRPDLEVLEDGDETEIGARGVSLSGGQKARVALARAVYARTKYVLLDDPLSAVDSHTSRLLFEKLLCGPLLKGRTVILVTHHVELVLPGTYYVVRMLDGRIDTQGTVADLRSLGILDDIKHDSTVEAIQQEQEQVEDEKEAVETALEDAGKTRKKPRQLVKDEHREVGGVKWSVYKTYLKASSYYIWVFLACIVVVSQVTSVFEKFWIKKWGEAYGPEGGVAAAYFHLHITATAHPELLLDSGGHHQVFLGPHVQGTTANISINLPDANKHPLFYVGVYAAIGLATAALMLTSITAQYVAALWASRNLFKRLLEKVVRATMRWHDVTPQGRMLNRFGKDIETIDSSLAGTLQNVNSSLATFFGAVLTITFIFPWFLVPAIIFGFVYRELALGYLHTGRDLRRMESNSKSPIFSDFGEVLEGIVTVRAFSAEQRFLNNLHQKVDVTTKMWYNFWMTNRWLLLNYDALGALAILTTTLFALSGYVKAGTAGLCITSAMSFTTSIYWACRFWTALELDLNSVERVVEYLDLPQEPPAIIESNRPPAYWPSNTSNNALIAVKNLSVRYAPELPPVLHDVSFSLKAGERVGLLGRTGSGKSTLAMSILRFADPSAGRIMIDGIDISTIGLYDLRSRLTFIPQDATLFSGTLRQNLDPFDEHDDKECLDALFRVQLINQSSLNSQQPSREASRASSIHNVEREDTIAGSVASETATNVDSESALKLSTMVSAGGSNFSQGQRQLIAMARALLRRSSIIVLDEATSSIDFATDAKIQATIREEFTNSLLLTVAHRLRTVIDYDRLIVLDNGKIAELDTPYNLIRKENGVFRSMCLKSGTFSELEEAAKQKGEASSS